MGVMRTADIPQLPGTSIRYKSCSNASDLGSPIIHTLQMVMDLIVRVSSYDVRVSVHACDFVYGHEFFEWADARSLCRVVITLDRDRRHMRERHGWTSMHQEGICVRTYVHEFDRGLG